MGFQASLAYSSLFILRHGNLVVYLLVFVDDIVLTGNDPQFLTSLISQLSAAFELKDLGSLNYFLGLQITKTSKGLFLSQLTMLRTYFSDTTCILLILLDPLCS